MGSDKKGKKQEKGSVGFVGNGALKVGTARLFWSNEKEPNDIKEEMQKHYGAGVRVKYVSIVDPEEYYDKLKLQNSLDSFDLVKPAAIIDTEKNTEAKPNGTVPPGGLLDVYSL